MPDSNEIEIVEYTSEFQAAFKALNKAWIEKSFELEEVDIEVLDDPEKFILSKGGSILMALYKGQAAGTCSLKNKANNVYELTKMTVDERFRGLKIGYLLGLATIKKARELNARKVELYSNTIGSAMAIPLYYKLGFHEVPLDTQDYKRANIKMELNL